MPCIVLPPYMRFNPILIFFLSMGAIWLLIPPAQVQAQSSAATVDKLECVNWDIEKMDPEMVPYSSKPSGPVFFDFQHIEGETTTKLIPHFLRDIECKERPAIEMFRDKRQLTIDHPLFARYTGPTLEFEKGQDFKKDIINILDLVEEHHFVKLPGKSKIAIRKSIAMKHDSFEFPLGAQLVHKVALQTTPQRPLEMRMLLKTDNGWLPIMYLPESDPLFKNKACAPGQFRRFFAKVVPKHDYFEKGKLPGHEGSTRMEDVSVSIRDLGWFESKKYGKLRMQYPVVGMAHCIECHQDVGPASRLEQRTKHMFVNKDYLAPFEGRSHHALNNRINTILDRIERLRLKRKSLEGKLPGVSVGKTPPALKKEPQICGPDNRSHTTQKNYRIAMLQFLIGPIEADESEEEKQERLAEEREKNQSVPEDWPASQFKSVDKKNFPKTLQGRLASVDAQSKALWEEFYALKSVSDNPTKQIGKKDVDLKRVQQLTLCGFVDLGDQMPFNADLVGFSRNYQSKFKSRPFEVLNPRECTMTEIRVGERVWIPTPVLPLAPSAVGAAGPRSRNSFLSMISAEADTPLEFIVEEKLPSGVIRGVLVDKHLSAADRETEIILSPLVTGDIAIELRQKDNRDPDFKDNFAFVGAQGIMRPSLKYLSCLDREPTVPEKAGPHQVMDMGKMNRDMGNPFRNARNTNFFNVHLVNDLFGVSSQGVSPGSQVNGSGHYMVFAGRRWDKVAFGLEFLLSPDRLTMPHGVRSPWTYGDTDKAGQLYVQEQHPHGFLGKIQAQVCRGDSGNRVCLSVAPVGEAPFGMNYDRNSNQALVIKTGGTHHALELGHAYQKNPIQLKTVIGKWRFDFGVFSGFEMSPWSTDLTPKKLDSYAARVQYNYKRNIFGASYSHINAQHPEKAGHAEESADPHAMAANPETEKPTLERSFVAWHEGTYMFYHRILKTIQWDVANAFSISDKKLDTPVKLKTFLIEQMLTSGKKHGLTMRLDFRQIPMSEIVEVRATDPYSGVQWVQNYTVGYFRTLANRLHTQGYKMDLLANYTRTYGPKSYAGMSYPDVSNTFAVGLRIQFMKSWGLLAPSTPMGH